MSDLLLMGGGGGLPRNGLVGLWDPYRQYATTGASQTLLDYSGLGNNGTLGASTDVGADDPSFTGVAMVLGGDDYLKTPADAFDFANISFGCVANLATLNDYNALMAFSDLTATGAETRHLHIYVRSTGKIHVYVGKPDVNGYAITAISNAGVITAGTPFVFQGSFGTAGNRFYVNGSPVAMTYSAGTAASTNSVASLQGPQTLCIGVRWADNSLGQFVTGSCYHAHVFNRQLTASEYVRSYVHLKSLMAGRGVTVA